MRSEAPFEVISEYTPSGDQPQAIAELTERINAGEDVVLLGATREQENQRRRRGLSSRCSAHLDYRTGLRRWRRRWPRSSVSCCPTTPSNTLSPTTITTSPRPVIAADGYLHREGLVDQRRGGAAAPFCHQQFADPARYGRGGVRLLRIYKAQCPAGIRGADGAGTGGSAAGPR